MCHNSESDLYLGYDELCFTLIWPSQSSESDIWSDRPLSTLWLRDELSQSEPAYKNASLDRPVDCPITIVVQKKKKKNHVAVLLSKTSVKRFRASQLERGVQTHAVVRTVHFASLSGRSNLAPGERSVNEVSLALFRWTRFDRTGCWVRKITRAPF